MPRSRCRAMSETIVGSNDVAPALIPPLAWEGQSRCFPACRFRDGGTGYPRTVRDRSRVLLAGRCIIPGTACREEALEVSMEQTLPRRADGGLSSEDAVADFSWEAVDRLDGWWHVLLKGELDLSGFDALDAALSRGQFDGKQRVLLDLRDLTFMDCSGLRAILQAAERADALGGEVKLIPGPSRVQRVFEITGVIGRLNFAEPS